MATVNGEVTTPNAEVLWSPDGGASEISGRKIVDRVLAGDVVVLRAALQALGLFEGIHHDVMDAVARVAGPDRSERVAATGVECVHDVLELEEIRDLFLQLESSLSVHAEPIARSFLDATAEPGRRAYACEHVWVRLHVPYDRYQRQRRMFSRHVGHLVAARAHRDHWLTHPANAVTLWIALGPTRRGNGMLVYPELWGIPIEPADDGFVTSTQRLGAPIGVALDPGDILVFNAHHVHSSEVNVTDETRVVLTARLAVDHLRFGRGSFWHPYRNLAWADSPHLTRFATLRSRLSIAHVRQQALRLRRALRRTRRR
jgi:hypothetical protein